MKRMLMLLLTSPCFILAIPEYEIRVHLQKNCAVDRDTHVFQPNQNFEFKPTCVTYEGVHGYTLNMKLLSVLNKKASLEYLINRVKPDPTSHQTFQTIEVDIQVDPQSQQQIPCLADDDAELYVRVTPANSSSCVIQ